LHCLSSGLSPLHIPLSLLAFTSYMWYLIARASAISFFSLHLELVDSASSSFDLVPFYVHELQVSFHTNVTTFLHLILLYCSTSLLGNRLDLSQFQFDNNPIPQSTKYVISNSIPNPPTSK
jgi:hypothetical protein